MIVIADTSPINYLILIDKVVLLRDLFARVVIPQSVLAELRSPRAPAKVWEWATHLPAWVDLRHAKVVETVKGLGAGELEALALAQELGADLVLLDDWDARKMALRWGLTITGTIGVLERAALRELIDLAETLKELREKTTCYMTDALVDAAMERVRQGKRAK